MNGRERYLETLLFGTPDRIPFEPGWPRRSTLARWRSEGLPEGADWFEAVKERVGVRIPPTRPLVRPWAVTRMNPTFEEKILEHRDGHYIVQDWIGNVVEIADRFDPGYLREALDFVTRRWHRFPVATRADFEAMKGRYRPDDPVRHPDDPAAHYAALRARDYPSTVAVNGPFWQLREWCGFEPLCMLFLDDPDFVREMISFWTGFVSATLARVFSAGVVDVLFIQEDMAYKAKPMISPAMTREFLKPAYDRWIADARRGGVAVVDMDSDGCVDELIPVWIEAGVDVCDPVEVAAGCDLADYRRRFGRRMAYRGGVDKRAMAKGGAALADELARVAPVAKDGGYIPGCDHGVPPDVSWPDFVDYARQLAELTGWRTPTV